VQGKDLNKAVQELLPGIIKESKKVIFNGDNYTDEWHKEAEKRGLPNLRNTVDALRSSPARTPSSCSRSTRSTPSGELHSRLAILSEHYVKTSEHRGPVDEHDGPDDDSAAALKYQTEVATAVNATKTPAWTTAPSSTCSSR